MKKILLMVFTLVLICLNSDVMAKTAIFASAEYLDGIAYVKTNGVFYHFKNARAIRNIDSDNIAYCIEPFEVLTDASLYNGYVNFDSSFNLTKEQWDKISLIVYYGYGYPGHLEEKWITITQLLIWRTVDNVNSFNWIDNTYDRNIIYPYESEIVELENLVKNHNVVPNISSENKMSINSVLKLDDSNNVLNNYEIAYSDFDASIEENQLTIRSNDEKVGKIILKRKQFATGELAFFSGNDTQNIVERGNIESNEIEVKVEVLSGSIEIKKIDSITLDVVASGQASLIGAVYDVYDSSNNLIGEIVINEENKGVLDNIAFGKYYIKEREAGIGYYLDKEVYEVTIDESNLNSNLVLSNDVIKSNVVITKYYGSKNDYENGNMKLESGIIFEFYDMNNNLVYSGETDENGMLEKTLPYGNYVIKQKNTTSGYSKVDDIFISVDETSNISINLSLTDLKVEVPNASIFSFQPLIINAFNFLWERIKFVI